MRRIHVMAAVIRRADGCILIAKRPDHAHQGGLWEFPGGKLETDEPRFDGLARELLEELGIRITQARPLIDIRHDYPDKSIRLDVWTVSEFSGEARGAEGQQVRWVAPQDLGRYEFPAANRPIVLAATLPERYLITPDDTDIDKLIAGLDIAGALGMRMVQLRQTGLSQSEYDQLAARLMAQFGTSFVWMLKGEQPPRKDAGWHLTARQLRLLHDAGWSKGTPFAAGPPLPQNTEPPQTRWERSPDREGFKGAAWDGLLAASCHDAQELQMANEIGADFVTLSPVLPTQSHPGAPHLGWARAAELIALANMPVYLLGGLNSNDLERAQKIGAQGIAAISGLWPSEGLGEGPR
ncbi:MAG: NUDIX domain-containing protein [Pseudomonas sp.]